MQRYKLGTPQAKLTAIYSHVSCPPNPLSNPIAHHRYSSNPGAGERIKSGAAPCRSVQDQLNDYISYLNGSDIVVHRLWLNIEPDPSCGSWTDTKTKNLALAKEWITAIRATKLKWGVYANGCVLIFTIYYISSMVLHKASNITITPQRAMGRHVRHPRHAHRPRPPPLGRPSRRQPRLLPQTANGRLDFCDWETVSYWAFHR